VSLSGRRQKSPTIPSQMQMRRRTLICTCTFARIIWRLEANILDGNFYLSIKKPRRIAWMSSHPQDFIREGGSPGNRREIREQ
jgi:hypothetical protein